MNMKLASREELAKVCQKTDTTWGLEALEGAFKSPMPTLDFKHALTRGNWHRPGGVVDSDLQPIHSNISQWAQQESPDDDVDELITRFIDSGYFVTRLAGKTHYFNAPCGDNPQDFIQLEVEQLQQVLERPLVDRDLFPDSLEEFVDPVDVHLLDPQPVGKPYYQFRRISPIASLVDPAADNRSLANLSRFFRDWQQSSAMEANPFCQHWILALREYIDRDGDARLTARPVSVYIDKLPDLPLCEALAGAELANAIHGYDRHLGYPFAWYFIMLSLKSSNYQLARAVLKDQMGAYDYLPVRDLRVLRQWEERPYGV